MENLKAKELRLVERAIIITIVTAIMLTAFVMLLKPASVYADARQETKVEEESNEIVIDLLAELPNGTQYESQYTEELP